MLPCSQNTPYIIVLLNGDTHQPRELLGGKSYSVNTMLRNQLPVPPHSVSPPRSAPVFGRSQAYDGGDLGRRADRMRWLEAETSRTFGRAPRPLLVSVRSGAVQSMPGMMDTILDLGINDPVEQALAAASTSPIPQTLPATTAYGSHARIDTSWVRQVLRPPIPMPSCVRP